MEPRVLTRGRSQPTQELRIEFKPRIGDRGLTTRNTIHCNRSNACRGSATFGTSIRPHLGLKSEASAFRGSATIVIFYSSDNRTSQIAPRCDNKLKLENVRWLLWLWRGWTYWLGSGLFQPKLPKPQPPQCQECGGELELVCA